MFEACSLDGRFELLLLQRVFCAFSFGAVVEAAIRVGLFDARLLGLLIFFIWKILSGAT